MTPESFQPSPSSVLLETRLQELSPLIDDRDIQTQFEHIIRSKTKSVTLGGYRREEVLTKVNTEFCRRLAGVNKASLYDLIAECTSAELEVTMGQLQNASTNGKNHNGEAQRKNFIDYEVSERGVIEGMILLNRANLPVDVRTYVEKAVELFRAQRDKTVEASRLKQRDDLRAKILFLQTVLAKLRGSMELQKVAEQHVTELVAV